MMLNIKSSGSSRGLGVWTPDKDYWWC